MLTVRDLMTHDVITVLPTTPIKDVARRLVEHRISGLPVVEVDGRLVGVVTEGDLMAREQQPDAIERRPLARILGDSAETRAQLARMLALTAGDAMSAPAVTIGPDASLAEAATAMARQHVNRLPVIEGDALVGVISRADIVRAFARSDEEVATSIWQDVLHDALWMDPDAFDVRVAAGKVRIRGRVERRSEADIIERMVLAVPGVVGVASELTWTLDDRDIVAPERDLVSAIPERRGLGR